MKKQLIISVSREYATAGHVIAEKLAERFGIPYYDNHILHQIAELKNVDVEGLKKYDEVPRNRIFSRSVRGFNNSLEENIAQMQFKWLKEKAQSGESFVIVGRCAESVLKGFPGLVSIFILGDEEWKIQRIMSEDNLSREKAEWLLLKKNKERKAYHNYYCVNKWGDSRNYDISINDSKLGIERTTDILETFIRERVKDM